MRTHRSGRTRGIGSVRYTVQLLICSLLPVAVWAGPVDINSADAATIARELQGIGLSKAEDIVAWREKNGAFKSPDDLRKIKSSCHVGNLTIITELKIDLSSWAGGSRSFAQTKSRSHFAPLSALPSWGSRFLHRP